MGSLGPTSELNVRLLSSSRRMSRSMAMCKSKLFMPEEREEKAVEAGVPVGGDRRFGG